MLTRHPNQDDELIWMALQPALQIVTHVLNTNHPFWITVMDMFQREKISHRRNPFGSSGPKLVSVWEYLKKPAMPAEAQALQDAGFDLSRAAAEYMMERVEITIGSAYRTTGSGTVDQIWGATTMMNDTDAAMRTILIEICAESIWPLLVPTFTQAEKAAISFTVASTLLHELAVSLSPFHLDMIRRFDRPECSTRPTWQSGVWSWTH